MTDASCAKPETFLAAAKIIDAQPKLCQKYLHDPDGNYCTVGAVLKVLRIDTNKSYNNGELNDLPEVEFLGLTLDEFYPRFECVSNWNDKRGRTCAEAAEFLRTAADFCKYYELIYAHDYDGAHQHLAKMHKEFKRC